MGLLHPHIFTLVYITTCKCFGTFIAERTNMNYTIGCHFIVAIMTLYKTTTDNAYCYITWCNLSYLF